MEDDKKPRFSKEEEAFRRGYHYGFIAGAQGSKVTEEEVREWRYHSDLMIPPGCVTVVPQSQINTDE